MRVLLVEDNSINQEVALEMFEAYNSVVVIACNGEEALERYENDRFDLILMDIQMPKMGGIEATLEIRKKECQHRGCEMATPIYAVSANITGSIKKRCLEAGMNGFLSKPFSIGELDQLIAEVEGKTTTQDFDCSKLPESAREEAVNGLIDTLALDNIRSLQRPGAPDILQKLVSLYTSTAPDQLSKLSTGLETHNAKMVEEQAHSLKSSSANLGANKLAALFKELERMGREQTLDGAEAVFSDVQSLYPLVCQQLCAKAKNGQRA